MTNTNENGKPKDELAKLKKSMADLKKQLTIVTLISALVGGGGVFGVIQWFVVTPVKIAADEASIRATQLDTEVKLHKETIASLERSLEKSEINGASESEIKSLLQQLKEQEKKLRDSLEQLGDVEKTYQKLASDVNKKIALEFDKVATRIDAKVTKSIDAQIADMKNTQKIIDNLVKKTTDQGDVIKRFESQFNSITKRLETIKKIN